tara:strand:+ start:72 stop:248 length:177 start_codon:yes stop_codon:yes gene_type:complete
MSDPTRDKMIELEPNPDCQHCDIEYEYTCWECEWEEVLTKYPNARRIGYTFDWEIPND